MKIIFVLDSLGTGGAERSNATLWYYLRNLGVEIKIIVLEHRQIGIEEEILTAGFDVTFLKGNLLRNVIQISTIIREVRPDLVHAVLFKASMHVRLSRFFTKFLLVEHLVNCTYAEIRFKDPNVNNFGLYVYKLMDRITSKWVDHFIAITKEVSLHYQKHLMIDSAKISVVYRGRESNLEYNAKIVLREHYKKELGIDNNHIVLLHAGRQEFQKGHIILLKAILALEKIAETSSVVFLFCGREGNASTEIKNYLENSLSSTAVKWLGHRYDLSRLMLCADVFVFPSLFEGLGGVLIEAQAAGLPIVCSNIKVFDEVVSPQGSLRFISGNEHDLAEKLKLIIEDKTLRNKFQRESLLNFESKFKLDSINQSIYELFLKLVSTKV